MTLFYPIAHSSVGQRELKKSGRPVADAGSLSHSYQAFVKIIVKVRKMHGRPLGAPMLTRRLFHVVALSLGISALSGTARGQEELVTVRIRADDSVRALIPPIAQQNLQIEPDQSQEAEALRQRVPSNRAAPVLLIIVGAIAVTELLEMIKQLAFQTYYGGVLVDTQTHPPTITSDPRLPGNIILVVEPGGKATRYTSDQLSLESLGPLIKGAK
jgi:hypothetical protein